MKHDWARKYRPFLYGLMMFFAILVAVGVHPSDGQASTWTYTLQKTAMAIAAAVIIALIERAFYFRHELQHIEEAVDRGLDKALPLTTQASNCGLVAVHPGDQNAGQARVLDAVIQAKKRVYVVAIAGKRPVDVQAIIGSLQEPRGVGCRVEDCRILLANPFRSGAIYRSFLSASRHELEQLVEESRQAHESQSAPQGHSTLLRRNIQKYAEALRNRLDGDLRCFQSRVRYYSGDCQTWLVIADDVLFLKQMTFSRASDESGETDCSHSIATPILEFRGAGAQDVILAYQHHVNEMWRAATDDWDWMEARYQQRDALYTKFFRDRWPWIRHTFENANPRQYRHKFIKDVDWPVVAMGGMDGEGTTIGTVLDASPGGLGIQVAATPPNWTKGATLSLVQFDEHPALSSSAHKRRLSKNNAELLARTARHFGIARYTITDDPVPAAGGSRVSLAAVRPGVLAGTAGSPLHE
ncbi:MAG: hypothetical protein H6819_05460 [Phycisphaerales bacterium]|nr:hypothetical protein [Phycisphaerales bacterium]MCB9854773.1 hypothetical protein [Phycisphaerales bacterium]MCB9863755.1 hypothetical protein [Phycisphaerales bacterium]